jgi:hypothetical protein
MKRWNVVFVLAIIAVMIAGPVFAQGAGGTSGSTGSHSAPSVSGKSDSGDFTGRHTMEGTVSKVNQKNGKLSVKTDEGTLDLHVPPSALSSVKKGDRIAVEIAIKPSGMAGSRSSTGGSASPATGSERRSGGSSSEQRKY